MNTLRASEFSADSSPVEREAAIEGNAPPRRPQARYIDSAELLAGASELIIVHGQREYRLRITSKGKLILTA